MNPTLLISATTSAWPDLVTVNWRRLSHGLWRVPEGDIHAAYLAECFPRIAVFSHEGRLFTNCGVHFCGAVHAEADCYALIPGGESARQKELAECGLREMPRNQAEMRRLLETGGDPAHATTQPKQTDLAL